MSALYPVTILVNKEMEEMLQGIFTSCGMDFVKVDPPKRRKVNPKSEQKEELHNQENPDNHGQAIVDIQGGGDDHDEGNGSCNRCPHCFLTPCVTERPQQFLGPGQWACEENSGLRKNIYKRYWKSLDFLGGWRIPEYRRKKLMTADGGEWAVFHRRELMPMCVLRQVRLLYPNPNHIPYMGHKWE